LRVVFPPKKQIHSSKRSFRRCQRRAIRCCEAPRKFEAVGSGCVSRVSADLIVQGEPDKLVSPRCRAISNGDIVDAKR